MTNIIYPYEESPSVAIFYLAGEATPCSKEEFSDYRNLYEGITYSYAFDQAKVLISMNKLIGYGFVFANNHKDAEEFFYDWLSADHPNVLSITEVPRIPITVLTKRSEE